MTGITRRSVLKIIARTARLSKHSNKGPVIAPSWRRLRSSAAKASLVSHSMARVRSRSRPGNQLSAILSDCRSYVPVAGAPRWTETRRQLSRDGFVRADDVACEGAAVLVRVGAGRGSHGADESDTTFPFTTMSWYFLDAVDVLAPDSTEMIACLGDSISATSPHHGAVSTAAASSG